MKYIRTKETICLAIDDSEVDYFKYQLGAGNINVADTIEGLIQIGDIVFYWTPSDDKEHCVILNYDTELHSIKYNAITKLLIPVGEDYKCIAKGFPSFNVIKGRRYLVSKGELELL